MIAFYFVLSRKVEKSLLLAQTTQIMAKFSLAQFGFNHLLNKNIKLENGKYFIYTFEGKSDNKSLIDVAANSKKNNLNIHQWKFHGGLNQQYDIKLYNKSAKLTLNFFSLHLNDDRHLYLMDLVIDFRFIVLHLFDKNVYGFL